MRKFLLVSCRSGLCLARTKLDDLDSPILGSLLAQMIQLTRLNNQALLVNSDLIKFVETAPDTVLTLVSGEKILVRESPDDVLQRIVAFRRNVLAGDHLKRTEPSGPSRSESTPSAGPDSSTRGSQHG